MSVSITLRLSESEADVFLKAEDRAGWHSQTSQALQRADFKIRAAIITARNQTHPKGTPND